MKKAGRVLAVLLIAVMFVSLFDGFNVKNIRASEITALNGKSTVILEIVPNRTMAQFGYLVAGQEPFKVNYNGTEYDYSSYFISNCNTGNSFANALSSTGVGSISGSVYTSENLLKTKLGVNTWNPIVWVRTPQDLKVEDIEKADLIVMHQSVVSGFPTGEDWAKAQAAAEGKSGDTNRINALKDEFKVDKKTFHGNDITWEQAYAILKRVAGVGSKAGAGYSESTKNNPISFIMDYNVYKSVFEKNSKSSKAFGYLYSDNSYNRETSFPVVKENDNTNCINNNAYKLFLMLEEMNPSTFYGLYFVSNERSYGINPLNGNLFLYGTQQSGSLTHAFGSEKEYDSWSELMLFPHFLSYSEGDSDIAGKLGWKTGLNNGDTFYSKTLFPQNKATVVEQGITVNGSILSMFKDDTDGIVDKLKNNLTSYNLDGNDKNRQHTYRLLCVSPERVDSYFNNSIVADIVKYEKDKNHKNLAGGAVVENIAMAEFVNLAYDLNSTYDAIYFGKTKIDNFAYKTSGGSTNFANKENIYWDGSPSATWNWGSPDGTGAFTYTLPGNDLTQHMKTKLESYMAAGKPVFADSGLASKCTGTKLASFLSSSSVNTAISSSADLRKWEGGNNSKIKTLMDAIDATIVDVKIKKTPTEYYSTTEFDFRQKGVAFYSSKQNTFAGFSNYINDSKHSHKRSLDFDFTVNGTGTYTVNLYLDMNADGLFDTSVGHYDATGSRDYQGEKFWTATVTAGTEYNFTDSGDSKASYTDIVTGASKSGAISVLPSNYVGPVSWKLEFVSNSNSNIKYSEYGVSACRQEDTSEDSKLKINILQIVPTTVYPKWGNVEGWDSVKNTTNVYQRFPSATVLLPTDAEYQKAKELNGNVDITSYAADYTIGLDGKSGIYKIQHYFDGVLSLDVTNSNSNYDSNGVAKSVDTGILKGTNIYSKNANGTASSSKLEGYTDSKNQVESAIAISGFYYYYIALQKDYDVSVTRMSTYEFNEKCKAGGSITFNGSDLLYKDATSGEQVKASLVMIGFCDSMDNMGSDGLAKLGSYAAADKPMFIGNGVFIGVANNNIAKLLRSHAGLDRYGVTSDSSKDAGFAMAPSKILDQTQGSYKTIKMTNKGTTTNYPYVIPEYNAISASVIQPFQLDVDTGDCVCFFTFDKDSETGVGERPSGDAVSNYYLFKKNNVTFCAMGYNRAGNSLDDAGSIALKLPEAALLVNVLLVASEKEHGGAGGAGTVITQNPDKNSYTSTTMVPNSSGVLEPKEVRTDIMYVDFDATKEISSTEKPVGNKKTGIVTDASGNSYFRHKVKAETTGTSVVTVVVQNAAGSEVNLELPVYEYEPSSSTEPDHGSGSAVSHSEAWYTVENGHYYYVDVPLYNSFYTGKNSTLTGFGLDVSDSFSYTIKTKGSTASDDTAELLNATIMKRGMFSIN